MPDFRPRITGTGFCVPAKIRTNDDPIFDWLKKHPPPQNPFTGYVERRVLGDHESLIDILAPAASDAIAQAGLVNTDIDLLLGYASVSEYANPNGLYQVHEKLGLPSRCYVVPLNNEFSNFNAALLFADSLIRSGRFHNALIAVGGNWTRRVSYRTPQAASAGDGAGAAVMSYSNDPTAWTLIDGETCTQSKYFGTMYMQGDRYPQDLPVDDRRVLWSDPYFHITEAGTQGFHDFGAKVPISVVTALLGRQSLSGADISLIAHQASQVLLDAWTEALHPAQTIQTIQQFANMTVASLPVNLAWSASQDPAQKNNLVLLALGPDMHANALLFQRGDPDGLS